MSHGTRTVQYSAHRYRNHEIKFHVSTLFCLTELYLFHGNYLDKETNSLTACRDAWSLDLKSFWWTRMGEMRNCFSMMSPDSAIHTKVVKVHYDQLISQYGTRFILYICMVQYLDIQSAAKTLSNIFRWKKYVFFLRSNFIKFCMQVSMTYIITYIKF